MDNTRKRMDKTIRRRLIFTIMLMMAIGNYTRLKDTDNVRAIEFFSIFTIGAIAGLLAYSIIGDRKEKPDAEK